jgi:hypothetical protein
VAVFNYPKTAHKRTLKPKQYKRYQTYKRFLRHEFVRVCVYCRQPDTSAPNLNYGVDHYRPKAVKRFSHLVANYSNLYYCCGNCNSYKNSYWPQDESKGPFIVNPCDFDMAKHLRFDSQTGRVEPQTRDGQYTEELLLLNSPDVVEYRKSTLRLVDRYARDIADRHTMVAKIEKMLKSGKLPAVVAVAELAQIHTEIAQLTEDMHRFTGEGPLPPIRLPFST